jgi:hypothetical protein
MMPGDPSGPHFPESSPQKSEEHRSVPNPSEFYNLYVLKPELARQWHPTKNGSLGPKDVTPGSRREVWWLCGKGHWWLARVCDRTRGMQCTFCRDQKRQGDRLMAVEKPELIKEWHPSRNADLKARVVSSHHPDKVWWICGQGHEWEATIRSRLAGQGCPVCSPSGCGPGRATVEASGSAPMQRPAGGIGASTPSTPLATWLEGPVDSHDGPELRNSPRYGRSAAVMIEKLRSGVLGYAQLHNFSAGGMMLLSDFALKPGEIISIKTDQPLFPYAPSVVASQMVWCRDMDALGGTNARYGIGVRRI